MRVAIFTDTYPPQVNGVARTLARLTKALETRGHGARVFTVDDPRAEHSGDVVRWPGIPFWGYPELRIAAPSDASVLSHLRAWSPTLVHVATPFGLGLRGVSAADELGIPVVSSYHTSFSEYARFYGFGALASPGWRYLRWFHNRARRTYAPTQAVSDDLAARGFTNVRLWRRGIDADVFNPRWRSDELRESWGAGPETVVVAYVGRLAKEKGVDVAIAGVARAQLPADHAGDMVFVVIGDGPHEAAMRDHAPAGTRFLGRMSGQALSAAYASADILVFPSTTDTFGNVLLEGMASRLAVLAADMPQSREVCAGAAAEFFAPGNAIDFGERLRRLVVDRGARETMRDSALRHARSCGWDAVFDALFTDYESVVNTPGPTRRADPPRRIDMERGFEIGASGSPSEATW